MTNERRHLMAEKNNGLTYIPNTGLFYDYCTELVYYLSAWEDNLLADDFYPAWKDLRVGGLREKLNAQYEAMANLIPAESFPLFKKQIINQLRKQYETITDDKKKKDLSETIEQIEEAETFNEVAFLLDEFHPELVRINPYNYVGLDKNLDEYRSAGWKDFLPQNFFRKFHKMYRLNMMDQDNLKQVNWTMEALSQYSENRYDMMQALCFAMNNNLKIPQIKPESDELYRTVLQGLRNCIGYCHEDENDAFWHGTWWDGKAFLEVTTPALRAKGKAQAYNDAIQALMLSPKFDLMRKYYLKKAEVTQNWSEFLFWDTCSLFDLDKHLKIQPINKVSLKANSPYLYDDILEKEIIPALEDFKTAEGRYSFLSEKVAEFDDYIKKNPNELQRLSSEKEQTNRVFSISTNVSFRDAMAYKTELGVANLLLSEDVLAERAWVSLKTAGLFAVSSFVPGGFLVSATVGVGIFTGASYLDNYDKYGTFTPDKNSSKENGANIQQRIWETCIEDSGLSNAFLDLKNEQTMVHIQNIVDAQKEPFLQAVNKIISIPEADFDNAFTYALNNTSARDKRIMELAAEAKALRALPHELARRKEEYEVTYNDIKNRKEAGENTTIAEEALIVEKIILDGAETGMFFATARRGLDFMDTLYKGMKDSYNQFRDCEVSLLNSIDKVFSARIDAEYEAEVREQILSYWEAAGRPIEEKEEQKAQEDNPFSRINDYIYVDSDEATSDERHSNQNQEDNPFSRINDYIYIDSDEATSDERHSNQNQEDNPFSRINDYIYIDFNGGSSATKQSVEPSDELVYMNLDKKGLKTDYTKEIPTSLASSGERVEDSPNAHDFINTNSRSL